MNVKAGKIESTASVRTLDKPGGLRRWGQGAGHGYRCGFVPSSAEVQSCITLEISFFISIRGGKKGRKKSQGQKCSSPSCQWPKQLLSCPRVQ